MEPLKDTVAHLLQELKKKQKGVPQENLEGLLKKNLTKKELGHIKFDYFHKGVLSIYVDSAVWLYHLNLRKEELLEKIGARLGDLKDIRLRIGEIK